MTIAHYLTLFRLCMSPLFLVVYLYHDAMNISPIVLPWALLSLLGISELTDALDGMVARRYNQVTDLGKLLDPMADSISHLSVFLTFTQDPVQVPMIFVFLFLYRDTIISTLRTICALRGIALAARPSGKIKAVIQALAGAAIVILMIPHSHGDLSTASLQTISAWIVGITAGYSVFTAVDYIFANRRYVARLLAPRSAKKAWSRSTHYDILEER